MEFQRYIHSNGKFFRVVTAKKVGTVTITVSSKSKPSCKDSCTIKIVEATPSPTPANRIQLVSSAAVNADIIVAKDGTGNFTTIQAAIDSVPSNSSKKNRYICQKRYIQRSCYNQEKQHTPHRRKQYKTIITYDN